MENLSGLLSCFSSLEGLCCIYVAEGENLRKLPAIIDHLKPCLQSLSLFFLRYDGSFGSFAEFNELRILGTAPSNPLTCLEGGARQNLCDVLPVSLASLYLCMCEAWILDTLQEFLGRISQNRQCLPLLDHIEIWVTQQKFDKVMAEKLVVDFGAVGIKLIVEDKGKL